MHLFIAFDGSDDGYAALQLLLSQFDRGQLRRVTIAVFAWPLRESPIWEKALAREFEVDDLHRAMADIANREGGKLRDLFAEGTTVKTITANGDPVKALLDLTNSDPPEIVLLGVTGGRHRHAVLSIVNEFMLQTTNFVVIVNGRRRVAT
jgi:hypothetical protein